jgi:hypothetical protein
MSVGGRSEVDERVPSSRLQVRNAAAAAGVPTRLLAMKASPQPWSPMRMKQHGPAVLMNAVLSLLLVQGSPSAAQRVKPPETTAEKINRALSAGPPSITGDATVGEIGGDGRMTILRQGTNGFTCMPGDPSGIGMPAMCADKVAMQWNSDFEHHMPKPSTTVPGIEYCWPAPRSAAIPTLSTSQVHLSPLDRTG